MLDLGLDSLMGFEVKQVLEDSLGTTIEDIHLLTFKEIAELQNSASISASEAALPQNTGNNNNNETTKPKLVPNQCLVKMSTPSSTTHDGKALTMFVVYSIAEDLQDVTSSLQCDVYGLQLTCDAAAQVSTIEELAGLYIKVLCCGNAPMYSFIFFCCADVSRNVQSSRYEPRPKEQIIAI